MKAIIESILFAHGDPVSLSNIATSLGIGEQEAEIAIAALREDCKERGIVLIEHKNTYQLATNPLYASYVENFVKIERRETLSHSAFETIAIIAYKGPLTKTMIDHIRGVNSSFILRNLLIRGLIERVPHQNDQRTIQYHITVEFLKYLGLSSIEELPSYHELHHTSLDNATTLPTQDA